LSRVRDCILDPTIGGSRDLDYWVETLVMKYGRIQKSLKRVKSMKIFKFERERIESSVVKSEG